MTTFKVGERVRCINASVSRLNEGQLYTVTALCMPYIEVGEVEGGFYPWRFIPAPAESNEERDLRLSKDKAALDAQCIRDMRERRALERDERNDAKPRYNNHLAVLTFLRKAEAQIQAAEGQIAEALRLMRDK